MSSDVIQLNDWFWTLQGEGAFTGVRSLFIRFPYCNYDCPWCDTEYNTAKKITLLELENFIGQEKARHAVITGGEPMMHKDLPKVLALLKSNGFYIACETNGSIPIPKEIDFVTCSPKAYTKGKLEPFYIHPEVRDKVSEWKYVIEDGFDFSQLKSQHPYPMPNVRYTLSPEHSQMEKQVEKIIAFIKNEPHWRLGLQTHKWINIP